MSAAPLYGCVEAGGTKFVLAIVDNARSILRRARVPTTTSDETLAQALAFFAEARAELGDFAAIGIASFGPVMLERGSPQWGHVLSTPKPGWSGVDFAGVFSRALGRPVGFDTDVNGAALAEYLWGAGRGARVCLYVTVGTGIGGGAVIDGRPLHGARHPEMGHMLPRRHPEDTEFGGTCPFHGDCLEGLASGPAILARWGSPLSELPASHPAHDIIADYLAQLVVAQQAMLSPERIVLGGGVMQTPGLLNAVRDATARMAGGYFGIDDYERLIVAPGLGDQAGVLGALALAQEATR